MATSGERDREESAAQLRRHRAEQDPGVLAVCQLQRRVRVVSDVVRPVAAQQVRCQVYRGIGCRGECPSISSDGTRVAYKVHVTEGSDVRVVAVLDVATGEERGVTDVWELDVDAATNPRILIDQARSPAVVR